MTFVAGGFYLRAQASWLKLMAWSIMPILLPRALAHIYKGLNLRRFLLMLGEERGEDNLACSVYCGGGGGGGSSSSHMHNRAPHTFTDA